MLNRCCEDCGDDVEGRRVRCPKCGVLLCSWCYHHSHKVFAEIAQANTVSHTDGGERPEKIMKAVKNALATQVRL